MKDIDDSLSTTCDQQLVTKTFQGTNEEKFCNCNIISQHANVCVFCIVEKVTHVPFE